MFGTTRKCQMSGCDRAASVNCFCCNTNICKRHLTEHIDAVKNEINPLANESKQMIDKFHDLTIEKLTESSVNRLHQWKNEMHEIIDEIFSSKIKEVEDLIEKNQEIFVKFKNQQLEFVVKMDDQVKELMKEGDATFDQLQSIRNHLTNVQTNLTNFENDFLAVRTGLVTKQLVTISSNLNRNSFHSGQPTTLFTSPNHVTMGTYPLQPTPVTRPSNEHRDHSTAIFTRPVLVPSTSSSASSRYSLPPFDETKRN